MDDIGSSTEVVVFTIESYDETEGVAVCAVQWAVTAGAVSDESPYGTIEVIDPMGCNFNEEESALIGRWGHATYLYPREHIDPYQEPRWVCLGLCCPDA